MTPRARNIVCPTRIAPSTLKRVERADEGRDEAGARSVVDVAGAADLLDCAFVHHDDPVGDRKRLLLVVGDEYSGDAELLLQRANLLAQARPDSRVGRRERLVEQEHPRARGERAGKRHALLLAAGKLVGKTPGEVRQLDQRQHLVDTRLDLGRRFARDLEAEGDVALDGHIGKERIGLKHHADRAATGAEIVFGFGPSAAIPIRRISRCRRNPPSRPPTQSA
jgi:hypothetical protein